MAGVYGVLGVWSSLPGVYKSTSVLKHLHEIFLTSFTLLKNKEAGKEKAESVRCGERRSSHRRETYLYVTYAACCMGTSTPTQTWRTPGFITEIFLNAQREHQEKKSKKMEEAVVCFAETLFAEGICSVGNMSKHGEEV